MDTSEKGMEEIIEEYLVKNNDYIKRHNTQFNKTIAIDTDLIFSFIFATQPEEWKRLKEIHGEDVKKKFLKRLSEELERRGVLDVMRKGIKDYGCRFTFFYKKPQSTMNEESIKLYESNMFSLIRQVYYSEKNNKSIDIVLFINGLPFATLELKDTLSGSRYTVNDAIKQYKYDRSDKEPLFSFKRCLVHFAVDEDLIYMTTKLQGKDTEFLPFNKGCEGGAGNPDSVGFKTEYLWKEVLTKKSVSEIIQDFLHLEDLLDENGNITGEQKLIFPRYHQLDAVRKIVESSLVNGTGNNYLIQHSAGSGKSNTIAWISHKLASLHNKNDQAIFDSVIIVTDRRILDRQLQRTVQQFEQVPGVVVPVKKTKDLKNALESGNKIIVTTLQKFPVIVDDISKIPGKNFAIIIDEAHSSQSGEMSKSMKAVLKVPTLEEAEKYDSEEETYEDEIIKEMEARGRLKNVSYYAFTATPKNKTFEIFGQRFQDGRFGPFHLYTMKQAIEEGFILDVLNNYTTYRTYFNLLKKIEEDPRYDRRKATALLRSFVELNEHTINKKVAIILEHFNGHVKDKIPNEKGKGQSKAMIVTRSRLHAVRYKLACDKFIKEKGYKFKTLVAFTGTVEDPDTGIKFTENSMNGFSEKQTVEYFKKDEYKFLIVANKFQTGFDQPLLSAMYVDKKLSGVAAVQTLSRTNRIYRNKDNPIILDFANDEDIIEKAFSGYYTTTLLSKGTDPNILYDLQHNLLDFYVYSNEDINSFSKIFFNRKVKQDKLHPILNEVVARFNELPQERKEEFKKTLNSYLRLYSFLSQIITFTDIDLEKLYIFGRLLIRRLPTLDESLPLEVTQQIDIDSYRIELSNVGIEIEERETELAPLDYQTIYIQESEQEALSVIIENINHQCGTEFTDGDKIKTEDLHSRIQSDPSLLTSMKVNTKDKVRLTFNHLFDEKLQEILNEDFDYYKKVNDNKNIREILMAQMFDIIYESLTKNV